MRAPLSSPFKRVMNTTIRRKAAAALRHARERHLLEVQRRSIKHSAPPRTRPTSQRKPAARLATVKCRPAKYTSRVLRT